MATEVRTLFQLPTDPEQFSVLLPPSELRKIDFSALEFATARKAVIEYIKTYFPNDFNDFVSNNGVIMLVELLSYMTGVLSLRADLLGNEAFLPTAATSEAVINHLALINQKIRNATPAVVDVECAVLTPVSADIHITPGVQFSVRGDDGTPITYEVFRSPTDINSDIVIPAGKRGVIAYGIEGHTDVSTTTSDGSANQKITINTSENVLEQPIKVEIIIDDIVDEWHKIDTIERAGANDRMYEVRFYDKRVEFIFGDNQTGMIPPVGAEIRCTYRLGGGSRGRIGVGVINEARPVSPNYPYTAPVTVNFRNVTPSAGGVDKETLDQARKRAPRDFATHDSIVTESDYAQLVGSFNHPLYGSVAKAIATVRTGKNANLIELYVLAEGASVDGFRAPVTANEGLKRAIKSYVEELNVLTDSVEVLDAKIKAVDLDITIVVNKSVDASVVKVKVEEAIADFFDIKNWDLGESLYVSQLYDTINKIDGVKYVDIFAPTDNILATGQIDSGIAAGVDINELVTLGNKTIKYYYEAGR